MQKFRKIKLYRNGDSKYKEITGKDGASIYLNSIENKTFNNHIGPVSSPYVLINTDSSISIEDVGIIELNEKTTSWYREAKNIANLNSTMASYALLRANPKLTGNIKLVVDSKQDLYIDTFKVNKALSKEKCHKIPVSYKEYYGRNVMSIFRNMTANDIYHISEKNKTLFTVTNNFSMQYDDTYRYGVKNNDDKLYKENFAALAPLCVNNILPDFFVIFKLNEIVDKPISSTETMKYLLKHGKQMASYDMREGSKLGTYIRNIKQEAIKIPSILYQNKDKNNSNMYTGISLDKGVVTNIYESVKFYNDEVDNQEGMNEYFTNAFERNRLLSPNLINLEFMFDDNDEDSLFSINTYYGLYIKCNDMVDNVYCNGMGEDGYTFKGIDDNIDTTVPNIENTDNILFPYYASKDWVRRITNDNKYTVLNDVYDEKIVKVGENMLNTPCKKASVNSDYYNSFITLKLNDTITPGEHLRIICEPKDKSKLSEYEVYEIIASSYEKYINEKSISREILNYYKYYDTTTRKTITNNIHRLSFYIDTNNDTKEIITEKIFNAFNSFDDAPFIANKKEANQLSIVSFKSDDYEMVFERITSDVPYNITVSDEPEDIESRQNIITYFGDFVAPIIKTGLKKTDLYKEYRIYLPIHFEILGEREISVIKFINIGDGTLYNINPVSINDKIMGDNMLYINADGIIEEYEQFSIKYLNTDIGFHTQNINIAPSFDNLKTMIVKSTDKDINRFNLYNPYRLSYGIAGFLHIKDFDFTVMDKSHIIQYYDASTRLYEGPIESENIINYITRLPLDDKSTLKDFIGEIYTSGQRYMEIPLTSPTCCKWRSFSYDASGNITKLYYNNHGFNVFDASLEDASIQQIDLNICEPEKDSNKLYTTKELLLNGEETIYNIIYSDSSTQLNTNMLNNKFYAINESLGEFIISGTKLKLSSSNTNALNINDINNFNIYTIVSPFSDNKKETNMFIDIDNNDILLVFYHNTNYDVNIKDDTQNITPNKYIKEIATDKTSGDIYFTDSDINIFEDNGIKEGIILNEYFTLHKYKNTYQESKYCLMYTETTKTHKYIKSIKIQESNINYYLDNIFNNNSPIRVFEIKDENTTNNFTLSEDKLKNVEVYIKQGDTKYKEYTSINLLNITLENPVTIEYDDPSINDDTYYQTFYTPYTNYITTYKSCESIKEYFKNSIVGNIELNSIENLEQLWINKYSENTNYCFDIVESNEDNNAIALSFDCLKNYNIMKSSFNNSFYRKYTRSDASNNIENTPLPYAGYKTGYIIKTFLNSAGIVMKSNNDYYVDVWSDAFIKDGLMYFNITNSLINKIYSDKNYNKSWETINIKDGNAKIELIKKTILPRIQINTKNTVEVYYKKGLTNDISKTKSSNMTLLSNIKTDIKYTNGIYYLTITPNGDYKGTYYPKFKINFK
jgi:hypothetical protein